MRKIYDMGNGEFLTEEERNARREKASREYWEKVEKFIEEYDESIPARNEELQKLFKREEKYIENPAPAPVGMKDLIDRVLEQIVKDVESGDLTAIEELLLVGVPDVRHLQAFIEEEGDEI